MSKVSSQLLSRSLPAPLRKVLKSLPVLAGSLVEQYVACGKPGCRCGRGQKHGPLYYLYWKEQGRSRSLYVPREKVAEMGRQIENYRGLQKEMARRAQEGLREWQRSLQKERHR